MSSASMWKLGRGATLTDDGKVALCVWAPNVAEMGVRVVGVDGAPIALAAAPGGLHGGVITQLAAGMDYFYRIDGHDVPDPVSRFQPEGVHGPSRVVDPAAFQWSDQGWTAPEMADLVLYEIHVGTFTADGTFEAVAAHLAELRDLGVNAIELMPVGEFPGARNWGYDGVCAYAAQSTYGGPRGLRRLVDAAHQAGIAVFLDVVYNHLGPEGNYLSLFGPYFTDRYATPWGAAINYDGADSDEVRRYFIDNALYWITELHIDGLRLDAVHAIYDFSARHILEELTGAVRRQAAALGRRVHVVAESDLNDARLVRPGAQGGYDLDGQWSDDFHHVVHAALTGERRGYYVDFGRVQQLAKVWTQRFAYDGCYSDFRRRRHGNSAADIASDRFVVFVQNHDQVGNRATGDRLATLVSLEGQKLAAALLLLSPYVPLLFMGEEYGETNPFLYFVSHGDPQLIEAVRAGRRREFDSFGWQGEVPDPQAVETFARSRLDRAKRRRPEHEGLWRLHRDLLRLRREHPALRPGAATVTAREAGAGAFEVHLEISGDALMVLYNLTAELQEFSIEVPSRQRWSATLATASVDYGGTEKELPPELKSGTAVATVCASSAVLYRRG